ncbi:MAG TPA: dynamin family protein [Alphaproteobacteria bacterium]|nr:dynamin family protein [Alphaproteobacteria bacterium]
MSSIGIDISNFTDRCNRLMKELSELSELGKKLGAATTSKLLLQSADQIESDKFRLVIIGEFSRGKSTLINALFGEKTLPSSVTPTTAVLTFITYSSTPTFTKIYRNGVQPEVIDLEEFRKLVAPPEPDFDEKSRMLYEKSVHDINQIHHIEVKYPLNLCKQGIEIIDTPGTNDLDEKREEITKGIIPECDAAIMVLHGKKITTDSEIRFLKNHVLTRDISKIFFVVNFKNQLTCDEAEKVINYAKKQLSDIEGINGTPRIFLVDAKGAMMCRMKRGGDDSSFQNTGFGEFEKILEEFLTNERGATKLEKHIRRAERLADELKIKVAFLKSGMNQDLEVLDVKIRALMPKFKEVESLRAKTESELRKALELTGEDLKQFLRSKLEYIADIGVSSVDVYKGPLDGAELAKYVDERIAPEQKSLQEELVRKQRIHLETELLRLGKKLNKTMTELNNAAIVSVGLSGNTQALVKYDGDDNEDQQADFVANATSAGIAVYSLLAWNFVPIIAIPFVYIAKSIFMQQKARMQALGKAKVEIDTRLRSPIQNIVDGFSRHWKGVSDKITVSFCEDIDRSKDELKKQIAIVRNLKTKKQAEADRVISTLNAYENRVEGSKTRIYSLKQEMDITG